MNGYKKQEKGHHVIPNIKIHYRSINTVYPFFLRDTRFEGLNHEIPLFFRLGKVYAQWVIPIHTDEYDVREVIGAMSHIS
jgi:hypothetical protein